MSQSRGHRVEPHTADVILHAWGPDFASCCEEAVLALVEICVDGRGAVPADPIRREIAPGPLDSMLLDLLDDVIFVFDTESAVPIRAEVHLETHGGLVAVLHTAERSTIEVIGSAPKAVSRSELVVDDGIDGVRCSFLIDV